MPADEVRVRKLFAGSSGRSATDSIQDRLASSCAQNFFETITLMESTSTDIAPPSKAQWCSLQSARPLSGVSGPPLENQRTWAASRPNGVLSSREWKPQKAQRWR
jgi:hypothetical protein